VAKTTAHVVSMDDRTAAPPDSKREDEPWPDVENRLVGHLRTFTHGVVRTADTVASLMQKASAWLRENRARIGLYDHPGAAHDLATRACDAAFRLSEQARAHMATLADGEVMDEIADYNEAVATMKAPQRRSVGWGWWLLSGSGVAVGCAALASGSRAIGGIAVAASLAAVTTLGWVEKKKQIKKTWHDAWRMPA